MIDRTDRTNQTGAFKYSNDPIFKKENKNKKIEVSIDAKSPVISFDNLSCYVVGAAKTKYQNTKLDMNNNSIGVSCSYSKNFDNNFFMEMLMG